jgi:hypothetical protein
MREQQIRTELFLLKMELNSFYGIGQQEVDRCDKIYAKARELNTELESIINQK